MLRYVGAVCGVIYSILLPLMVHIMVVSTHSVVNTGRFVRRHPRHLAQFAWTAPWHGLCFDGVRSRLSLPGYMCAGVLWVDDAIRLALPHSAISTRSPWGHHMDPRCVLHALRSCRSCYSVGSHHVAA